MSDDGFYVKCKEDCAESVRRALSFLRSRGRNVIGLYGSGARYICMPKGDYDLNVLEEGELSKDTYVDDENSISIFRVNEDADPWVPYPSTKESLLPIGAVLALHSRCLDDKCRRIVEKVVGRLSLEDRREIGKSMIYNAIRFLEKAEERGKNLVRAFCDFLPYGELWKDNPERIPALEDNLIENVAREGRLRLCIEALKLKHGSTPEERRRLADEGLRQISYDVDELRRAWENVKSKMRKVEVFGGIKNLGEI